MISRTRVFWPSFLVFPTISTVVLGTCYAPNGSATNDLIYQPCIAVLGIESMCCALNTTVNTQDTCDPTGLCRAGKGEFAYYRTYCTDKTWQSPNCLPKTTCDDAASPFCFHSLRGDLRRDVEAVSVSCIKKPTWQI